MLKGWRGLLSGTDCGMSRFSGSSRARQVLITMLESLLDVRVGYYRPSWVPDSRRATG